MMKYVYHETMGFIIFESHLRHDQFVSWFGGKNEIESCGIVLDGDPTIKCIGGSTTIGKCAKEQDTKELRKLLESL